MKRKVDYVLSHLFSPSFMLIPNKLSKMPVVMSEGIALTHTHKQNILGRDVQDVSMMRISPTSSA